MKFLELDTVVLLKNCPTENLTTGDIGVIIMAYKSPCEAYEVEFVDSQGKTKAQLTLYPDEIKKYSE